MNKFEVGKAIKYYRCTKNVKQAVIAKHFAYDRSKISRIEHGASNDDEMYVAMLIYLGGSLKQIEEAEKALHKLIADLGEAMVSRDSDLHRFNLKYKDLELKYPFIEDYELAKLIRLILSMKFDEYKLIDYKMVSDADNSFTCNENAMLQLIRAMQVAHYGTIEESIRMLQAISSDGCGPRVRGAISYYLARNYYQRKNYEMAKTNLEIAIQCFEESGQQETITNAKIHMAVINTNLHNYQEALDIYSALMQMEYVESDYQLKNHINHNLASLYIRIHNYEAVIKCVDDMQDPGVPSIFLKAYAHYRLANPRKALDELEYASSVFDDIDNPNMVRALQHFIINDEETEAYLVDLVNSLDDEKRDENKLILLEMLVDYYKKKANKNEEAAYLHLLQELKA